MTAAELERLFRTYGPLIHERCRRILGDGAAADDATQETFVRVHRHLAEAPNVDEAVPWIYRIATNYCLNELRDRGKRAEPTDTLPEIADDLSEARLADAQLARALIDRVPAKLRACAYLTYVDGLTQDEVAKVLGISRRSVVNHLADFLARARKFVARSEP
ncbi:MAG: sigma-70 family RNA polymerase sigma factor [Deltaproteobacteria bacterium]|nr:sigma-70 family RNA polymerase sigma factor [Deltaproteobacteria bacterium]